MTVGHSIRTWALVAVAITSAAMIGFAWWLIDILASPDWCSRAVGAAKYADGRPQFAVQGCYDLMTQQVEALALNSHYAIGTLALSLLTLVVIVLAGGRLSFKAGSSGVSADMSREQAARQVADAAEDEAQEIAGDR